jgi:hypothetical protein
LIGCVSGRFCSLPYPGVALQDDELGECLRALGVGMMDAVGDLHGDIERTQWALQLAGVLSKDGQHRWTGGTTLG